MNCYNSQFMRISQTLKSKVHQALSSFSAEGCSKATRLVLQPPEHVRLAGIFGFACRCVTKTLAPPHFKTST